MEIKEETNNQNKSENNDLIIDTSPIDTPLNPPTDGGGPDDISPEEPTKSYGPIIGIVIIVVLIIVAGFYFWGKNLEDKYVTKDASIEATENVTKAIENATADTSITETEPENIGVTVSESDTIEDLESELNSTIIDELDAELESIDAELNF